MRTASRPILSAAPAGLPAPGGLGARYGLAAALAAGGALCGILALRLEAIVARFDTLAYLLDDPAGKLNLLRMVVGAAGAAGALLALAALRSARLSAALGGVILLATAAAALPLGRRWFAPPGGLEESLVYRLRGLADIGLVGGLFLLFLAWLPRLLARPAGSLERQASEIVGRAARRWMAMPAARREAWIAGLALGLALAIGFGVLADFPGSSDESSYVTQARIFSTGRLWVPAPPRPEFFHARSMILDAEKGRFFAKAFPGWALLLAVGASVGSPWIVNPILSALTLILAGRIGRRLLGAAGEPAVAGMMLLTPFFLFNAASYFNHPATLFCIALFLLAVLRLEDGAGAGWALAAGAATGAALSMRPAAAAALTLPFLVWLGARWARRGEWSRLGALLLPIGLVLVLLAAYNQVLFGSPWTSGYAAYDASDIRARLGADNLSVTLWWLVKLALWTIPGSVAGLYFLGKGRSMRSFFREQPILALAAVSLLLLAAGYLIFQNKGSNEYGPRYYYDGFLYLALLMTAGWIRAPEILAPRLTAAGARRAVALLLGAGVALCLCGSVPLLAAHYRDKTAHNRDLYRSVSESGLSSALVFLRTGSGRMPPGDLLRNPLDFRTGVVYARDLGTQADRGLAALYADRPALVYRYDPVRRTSTLVDLLAEGR
ncbi:MAG TPA: hypothetical protein VGR67_14635 [Candidatus Polarisedimenticolia bacterium]|nr:hypothetical protein [Candidatus Polarisedimenticolia bacterium]